MFLQNKIKGTNVKVEAKETRIFIKSTEFIKKGYVKYLIKKYFKNQKNKSIQVDFRAGNTIELKIKKL